MKPQIYALIPFKLALAQSVLNEGVAANIIPPNHTISPQNVIDLSKDWYDLQQDLVMGMSYYKTRAKEICPEFYKDLMAATSIFVNELLTE